MTENRKRVSSGDAAGEESLLRGVKAVVMDIEGTTTPISYVKDCVFPFVRENVRLFLEETYSETETQADIQAIREHNKRFRQACLQKDYRHVDFVVDFLMPDALPIASSSLPYQVNELDNEDLSKIPDSSADKSDVIEAVLTAVACLMDSDSKATPLKTLQGHVWRYALDSGKQLTGLDVYDDVVKACKKMKADDIDLYIYSSGSVEAQKLLFGKSSHGDMLKYFSGHFDTGVGAKREKESYMKITESVNKSADHILFLTDIPQEAEAALGAGLRACLVVREGNAPLTEDQLNMCPVIHSFSELFSSTESSGSDEPECKQSRVETTDTNK